MQNVRFFSEVSSKVTRVNRYTLKYKNIHKGDKRLEGRWCILHPCSYIYTKPGHRPEQPALTDPALSRVVELDDLKQYLPTSAILWSYGSHEFYTQPRTKTTHIMFIFCCTLSGCICSILSSHDKLPAMIFYCKERKVVHITFFGCFLNIHSSLFHSNIFCIKTLFQYL